MRSATTCSRQAAIHGPGGGDGGPRRSLLTHGGAAADGAHRQACGPTAPTPRGSAHRRLLQPTQRADQRLLRQSARHGHGVASIRRGRRLRRPRPQDGPAQVDRHAGRPDLRAPHSELRALAEISRLRRLRRAKFVQDFVGGLVQGDGPRPLRPPSPQRRIALGGTRSGAGGRSLDLPGATRPEGLADLLALDLPRRAAQRLVPRTHRARDLEAGQVFAGERLDVRRQRLPEPT